MKRLAVALSAAVVSLSAMANGSVSEQKADSLSQAMATSWGAMLKAQLSQRVDEMKSMGFALDKQKVIVALGSYLKGEQMAFTAEEAEAYLNAYVEGLMPKEEALSLESQQEFLDKQLSRPGVIKTASGLVFETVKEGTGRSPKLTDKVRVLYKGRLADGTVFDSTDNEGPIEFDVNRLVKGFTEGLLLMREGGQYRLFIPASLGYGERGAGGVIPPNAALDFEVTLIEIINQ
ncbi:MAG: FKBP-type peptidyl-prolyl cis-trans isomerase [Muribaculaceae bacterium]|nr:FKBP-type peptidyl-prolyl cis-trans isomerase [Muribaculaceae bacterium]